METNPIREAFEKWAILTERSPNGEYLDKHTQALWQGWHAARATPDQAFRLRPLYAHPPAQPAITDEEIVAMALNYRVIAMEHEDEEPPAVIPYLIMFARALLEGK